jgi:plastocyanin
MRLTYALALGVALLAAPAHAAPVQIDAYDNAFTPRSVTVTVGDKVTWRNIGDSAHEVTSAAFRSGNLDKGDAYSWTPSKAGTYAYVCRYHETAGMKATLVVRASATGHPKTGGDPLPLGLLALGAAAVAGASLRYGWRVR